MKQLSQDRTREKNECLKNTHNHSFKVSTTYITHLLTQNNTYRTCILESVSTFHLSLPKGQSISPHCPLSHWVAHIQWYKVAVYMNQAPDWAETPTPTLLSLVYRVRLLTLSELRCWVCIMYWSGSSSFVMWNTYRLTSSWGLPKYIKKQSKITAIEAMLLID